MINLFPSLLPDPKQIACEHIDAVKELFREVLPPQGFFETFRRTLRDYSLPKGIADYRWKIVDRFIKTPALGLTSELHQSYVSLASNSNPSLSRADSLQQFLSLNQEEILRAGASCPSPIVSNSEAFAKFAFAFGYIHLNILNGAREIPLRPIWTTFLIWDALSFIIREEGRSAIVERALVQIGAMILAMVANKVALHLCGVHRRGLHHLHN